MTVLISGSLAFDTVMMFQGRFKDHLLPEQLHILNVSFPIAKLHNNFGGCAGNAAYGMRLLGLQSSLVGAVGTDFTEYRQWLHKSGVDCKHVHTAVNDVTARAFIITDQDNNQITAFYPGAMHKSHLAHIPEHENHTIALLSPSGRDGMLLHANELAARNIPFLFDPGQGTPMFSRKELLFFIEHGEWLACNEYELRLIEEKCRFGSDVLRKKVAALIVTGGNKGATIYTTKKKLHIPAATPHNTVDPTGCGDAHRAGLIFGLINNMDWETTGRIASLMGTLNVEQAGTQNYSFTRAEFAERFHESFAYALND